MRRDLANARMGQFVGADNRTYELRAPQIDGPEIEALIESGCPVVTYLPGGRWESPDGSIAVVLVFHA